MKNNSPKTEQESWKEEVWNIVHDSDLATNVEPFERWKRQTDSVTEKITNLISQLLQKEYVKGYKRGREKLIEEIRNSWAEHLTPGENLFEHLQSFDAKVKSLTQDTNRDKRKNK